VHPKVGAKVRCATGWIGRNTQKQLSNKMPKYVKKGKGLIYKGQIKRGKKD